MKKLITRGIGRYVNTMASIAPETAGRHAFRVFCYPARIPLKAHQKAFLDTAEKFNFQHQDTYIQGYKWGHGPKKVLFLHGWQSHSFRWKNYIEALPQDEYSIYAIDAPGHGFSKGSFLSLPLYSKVMQQLINSLGEIDTVVSHSIGGFAMLYTMHRAPELPVRKLVVMGAPGEVGDFLHFYKQVLNLTDKAFKHTLAYFEKAIGKPFDFFSAAKFAASVKVPGLIIHDKGDQDAPYHYAERVHQAWKGSRLLTTEGFGHNLKSPAVVEAVTAFIKEGNTSEAITALKKGKKLEKQLH